MKSGHIFAQRRGTPCARTLHSSAHAANDKPCGPTRRIAVPLSALALSFCVLSCHPAPPVPKADETPEREFILERFSFEERRDGLLLWRGHAARGTGDVATSDVHTLALTRVPQKPHEMPLHIRADIAHLALAEGKAHFHPVWATDDCARSLAGAAADYDEATATLRADGPIHIETPQGHLDAASAILCIDAGRMVLEGPITGRFVPPANPTPAP